MELVDLNATCPTCGEVRMIARGAAGMGQVYVPDRLVTCTCGTAYIASAAILSGSPSPVSIYVVPRDEEGNLVLPPKG